MIDKFKTWLFQGVILKKVVAKFVKHGVTTLAALLASNSILSDSGVSVDWTQFETWATLTVGGLAGAAWNYIDHRFVKKKS